MFHIVIFCLLLAHEYKLSSVPGDTSLSGITVFFKKNCTGCYSCRYYFERQRSKLWDKVGRSVRGAVLPPQCRLPAVVGRIAIITIEVFGQGNQMP